MKSLRVGGSWFGPRARSGVKLTKFATRPIVVGGFLAIALAAGVAWAASVHSSYGATNTSNMVDANDATYGIVEALPGTSTPSCPPAFSAWITSPSGPRGCTKGLSSSWKIMGWTLIDLGDTVGTTCGNGCTWLPRLKLSNGGDGNPSVSGGSCSAGCTAKFRVFSTNSLAGGSTSWTHHGSHDITFGGSYDYIFATPHRYWLVGRQNNGVDESDPRVKEILLDPFAP